VAGHLPVALLVVAVSDINHFDAIFGTHRKTTMATITKALLTVALFAGVSFHSGAQIMRDYVNNADRTLDNYKNKVKGGSLSSDDIAAGLREALQVGAKNATGRVSAVDGFFGNALIKVLMPPEAKKVETTLREVGMGAQVDNAILSMNRAAEDASAKALPIFLDAIKNISIDDGMKILKGNNDAATQYLKSKTLAALTAAFKPVIQESLDKVNATKYWADIINAYNGLPTTFKKINPDLTAYVTERALNGVFVYIADEEAKIRKNPAARVSDLLKKVFATN